MLGFTLNGRPVQVPADPAGRLTRLLRDDLRPDRHQGRLRRRRLRRLHRAAGRRPGLRLPGRVRPGRGPPRSRPSRGCRRSRPRRPGCNPPSCATAPRNAASARRACWWPPPPCSTGTRSRPRPRSMDAIGGVLCRCTGYRKIIAAILDARTEPAAAEGPAAGHAVGAADRRGWTAAARSRAATIFGADETPSGAAGPARHPQPASPRPLRASATSTASSPPIPASSACSPPGTCRARTASA